VRSTSSTDIKPVRVSIPAILGLITGSIRSLAGGARTNIASSAGRVKTGGKTDAGTDWDTASLSDALGDTIAFSSGLRMTAEMRPATRPTTAINAPRSKRIVIG